MPDTKTSDILASSTRHYLCWDIVYFDGSACSGGVIVARATSRVYGDTNAERRLVEHQNCAL